MTPITAPASVPGPRLPLVRVAVLAGVGFCIADMVADAMLFIKGRCSA